MCSCGLRKIDFAHRKQVKRSHLPWGSECKLQKTSSQLTTTEERGTAIKDEFMGPCWKRKGKRKNKDMQA